MATGFWGSTAPVPKSIVAEIPIPEQVVPSSTLKYGFASRAGGDTPMPQPPLRVTSLTIGSFAVPAPPPGYEWMNEIPLVALASL